LDQEGGAFSGITGLMGQKAVGEKAAREALLREGIAKPTTDKISRSYERR
jgi:hypothetical protein